STRRQPGFDQGMVVVAGGHDQLAVAQRPSEILEERPCGVHRVAHGAVSQLEHVAEQDDALDARGELEQRRAQLSPSQQVRARQAPQVQVGEDQRAHGSDACAAEDCRRSGAGRQATRAHAAQEAPPATTASRICLGSMKRTSSRTTSNSETSLTPRERKKSTSSPTRFSGALAPDEMPTTRTPLSHCSCTSPALSIRGAAVPQSRATSTRRTEWEELREPITSIRSQLLAICLTAA